MSAGKLPSDHQCPAATTVGAAGARIRCELPSGHDGEHVRTWFDTLDHRWTRDAA